jgi:XTP/dITP diphosphohydrolase
MTALVIGTRNPGKLLEIKTILGDVPYALVSLADYNVVDTAVEDAPTYAENASIKAKSYAAQTGAVTLADDSGLEVEALDGAPGIFSARYAGEGASDAERRALLLSEMSNRANRNRKARFLCAVAIARPDQSIVHVAEGSCKGMITDAPRGEKGFGYDPLFVPDGYDLTFAELDGSIKNRISHRGKALAQLRDFLLRAQL